MPFLQSLLGADVCDDEDNVLPRVCGLLESDSRPLPHLCRISLQSAYHWSFSQASAVAFEHVLLDLQDLRYLEVSNFPTSFRRMVEHLGKVYRIHSGNPGYDEHIVT